MISPDALRRLAVAADLALEREVQALQRIDEAAAALAAEVESLRRTQPTSQDLLDMRGHAAHQIAVWDVFRDRRLREIAAQLANLAADREKARLLAARACGRVAAIGRLAEGRRG